MKVQLNMRANVQLYVNLESVSRMMCRGCECYVFATGVIKSMMPEANILAVPVIHQHAWRTYRISQSKARIVLIT